MWELPKAAIFSPQKVSLLRHCFEQLIEKLYKNLIFQQVEYLAQISLTPLLHPQHPQK